MEYRPTKTASPAPTATCPSEVGCDQREPRQEWRGFYCLTRWGTREAEKAPRMGEVIPSGNGDGVLTGREPHNTHQTNEALQS